MPASGVSGLELRLLGPVEAAIEGIALPLRRRQERGLLAILALEQGRLIPAARLIDLLWEEPPSTAGRLLHAHVSRLRAALRPAGPFGVELTGQAGGYRLVAPDATVDVWRFRALVDEASTVDSPTQRRALLHEALSLWRGPALADVATGALRREVCAELEEIRWTALEQRLEADLSLGRHAAVTGELRRYAAEHPLRVRFTALLMRALSADGRDTEALSVFAQYRTELAEQFGVDPEPELLHLHTAILRVGQQAAVEDPPRTGIPAQLPAAVTPFLGRAVELDQLDRVVDAAGERPDAVVIIALCGTAGVGKTALAVHWAHRVRPRFPDGQLYVNLRGFDGVGAAVSPATAIRRFLDALDVPATRIPTDLDAQAALYRSLLADRRMLIVLDNARDAEQVRPLLPGSPECLVLITSRDRLTGLVAGEGAHPVILDVLSAAEARNLFAVRLGAGRVVAEAAAVDKIIDVCAGLPLALAVVAARAATHPDLPLTALVDELVEPRTRLEALAGTDPATDVRTVFSWSYQALTNATARLFRLLGLHPGPDISLAAVSSLAAVPSLRVRPLLGELLNAHLIAEHTPGRYTFHDLLHAYAHQLAHRHDPNGERHTAAQRILDHYLHTAYGAARLLHPQRDPIILTPPQSGVTPEHFSDHAQALTWFSTEHQALLACVDHAAQARLDQYVWQLAWTLADFLDRQGHWHDRVAVQRHALAASQRQADPATRALAHRHLARAYRQVGRHNDARIQFGLALDLYRRSGDRAGEAATHHNLSALYERQGNHHDALHHARQAVDLYQACGHETGHANALNAAGWCQAHLGEHHQGIALCQQALAIQQAIGDRPGQAATFDSLGYIHDQLGERDHAVDRYRSAIARYQDLGDRYHEAETLASLGNTHAAAGRHGTARQAWQQALTILEELGHPDADTVRATLNRRHKSATPDR
jgi:DNA-binding SARP family transcriptional activator/tetratricopeptide (TPR) repeat protein